MPVSLQFQWINLQFTYSYTKSKYIFNLSVHENVGVYVDGGDLDRDVVLQLTLGRGQLLVSRLRLSEVIVQNLRLFYS